MDNDEPVIKTLLGVKPRAGRLEYIGLRPARRERPQSVDAADITTTEGLIGDHFSGRPGSSRQLTLIQAEHLEAVAAFLGIETIEPQSVRRNLVVRGLNLYAFRHGRIRIGNVELEGTGLCHPCSLMEEALGPGGYNAMRGHGGLTARVIVGGKIRVGDEVDVLDVDARKPPATASS